MKNDPDIVRRFLTHRFGHHGVKSVLVGAGDWSTAYRIDLDNQPLVVRFGAYREDFEKDCVMGRYTSDCLPIPKVLEIGKFNSLFYAISEWVPGVHLDSLGPVEIAVMLPYVLDGLHRLQQQDLTGTAKVGLWRPKNAGPSWAEFLLSVAHPRERLAGWREELNQFPHEAAIFDNGVQTLQNLVRRVREVRGIVHNDLLNRNVLVHEGRLTGVIDWGNAFYGDPLYDIALLLYWWPWYPKWKDVNLDAVLTRHWDLHGGAPAQLEERLHCCLIHIGLDHVAYSAFRHRREDMQRNAAQVLGYLTNCGDVPPTV